MPRLSIPLLFGTGMSDTTERINIERLRRERADRLRNIMKEYGIPAFLLTRADNIRYATGTPGVAYMPMMSYCLFFAEDDPIMWEHPPCYQQEQDQIPWIKPENWRPARSPRRNSPLEAQKEESKLLATEIKQELQERGLMGEKLAQTAGWDRIVLGTLRELGIEVVDGWPMMMNVRSVKTKDEINCWKMANAIVDKAFYAMYEALKPGTRDVDIKGAILKSLWESGVEDTPRIGVWSGPYTWPRGVSNTDRFIEVGDIVYADIYYVSWMGYKTCVYRTFIVGRKPNQREQDWHKRLLEQQNGAIDEIKPGATTADVVKHFPTAREMGFPDEAYASMVMGGHGIGLHQYEYPSLSRYTSLRYPQVFEAGNTLAVETSYGEMRVGGSRMEDMVLVTEEGAEIVNHWPREEIIASHVVI